MIFHTAIQHEIMKYEGISGTKAKYLILSDDKEKLLLHECFTYNTMENLQKQYDPTNGRKFKTFMGLEVVKVGITFQGSMGWGLGE